MDGRRDYVAGMSEATLMTAEELLGLRLPGDKRTELIRGRLVVRDPGGARPACVGGRLGDAECPGVSRGWNRVAARPERRLRRRGRALRLPLPPGGSVVTCMSWGGRTRTSNFQSRAAQALSVAPNRTRT